MIKLRISNWGDYSGLFKWAQCNCWDHSMAKKKKKMCWGGGRSSGRNLKTPNSADSEDGGKSMSQKNVSLWNFRLSWELEKMGKWVLPWSLQENAPCQHLHFSQIRHIWGFPSGSAVKNLPAMQELQETWVQSLGPEGSPGGERVNPLQYSCLESPLDRGD